LEPVRQFLKQYNNNVLSRLELGYRQPPLYFAITNSTDQNSLEMMKVMVQFGANSKYKDQNDQTVLFYACRDGKLACCNFLVEQGLDIKE
jgi:ankyrin repeat protein